MYEKMIESSLNYIEEHITEELSLKSISEFCNISSFHFSRIFSFMIGETYREYVLKRKISHSLVLLNRNESIISTAYNVGFSYTESFTRAFKQVIGISPKKYQLSDDKIDSLSIGKIISRDWVNFKGKLTIKCTYEYHDDQVMYFKEMNVDQTNSLWRDTAHAIGERFLTETQLITSLDPQFFYNEVKCMSSNHIYKIKYLKKILHHDSSLDLKKTIIKGGWFGKFHYEGNINDLYESFKCDIHSWIKNKDEKLEHVGNGFLVKYSVSDMSHFDVYIRLNRVLGK